MEAHPGTLNLEISEPEDLRVFQSLKDEEGIQITPHEPSFCSAMCYPVLIAGKVKGAIIFPLRCRIILRTRWKSLLPFI
jgi:CTP-dependent riboflavin kinase